MVDLRRISVIVPVKNGRRYLGEVLDAVRSQRVDAEVEALVVDSGSTDGSVDIARAAGARVLAIDPAEFGHGKTRNLAAEQAGGEALAFLTQDATPAGECWLSELVAPLDESARVGLSFGPHLPRDDTSPMIARELVEFFTSFGSDRVRIDHTPDPADPAAGFFSNVNSCVLRACWEEVRFRDVEYAEDQAFAADTMAAGWKKAYVPSAPVLHAHDYPFTSFMRRYFDEYRGLQETIGHVEPFSIRQVVVNTRAQVKRDLAYEAGVRDGAPPRPGLVLRSASHHAGRSLFAALGSRSERLPRPVQRGLSLERRAPTAPGYHGLTRRQPAKARKGPDYVLEHARHGEAALVPPTPGDAQPRPLHIAWIVPPFRRGSGGHMALFRLARELERRGHSCSIWLHDPYGTMGQRAAAIRREIVDHFAPLQGGLFDGFDDWHGADVAIATGWQTAYPAARLDGCKLKAYLVQDYEPDFYPASADRLWAEATYRMQFRYLASSPWLENLLRQRYGAEADSFEYGVDFDVYRPLELDRDANAVLFYGRPATPRRATELGLLALEELRSRCPDVRVVMFGDAKPPAAPFEYEFSGLRSPHELAELYGRATLGLVLSLTNYSLIPKEMMACGLPVVDVRGASAESVFGVGSETIELVEPDPVAIAGALAALLEDDERRLRIADSGQTWVQGRTWGAAAETIEATFRRWLAERGDTRTSLGADLSGTAAY